MDNLRDFVVEDDVLMEYNGKDETVVIPEGIKTIGRNAFWGHLELRNVVLPESLEAIEPGAFAGTGLVELSLPACLKTIEQAAFEGCRALEAVTIPASVSSLSIAAFHYCENLKSIEIEQGNRKYFNQDGMVCSHYPGFNHLVYLHTCPPGISGDVVLSGHVDKIKREAFADCKGITSVKLPDGLQTIREAAFYGCAALERIEIPQSVTQIHSEAFAECTNLKSVVLPDSLNLIGSCIFDGCKQLAEIVISDEALVRYVQELDLLDAVYLTPCYDKLNERYETLCKAASVENLIGNASERSRGVSGNSAHKDCEHGMEG